MHLSIYRFLCCLFAIGLLSAKPVHADWDCCDPCSTMSYEVSASYLYWGASEDYLGYAVDNINFNQTGFFFPQPSSHLKEPKTEWKSGWRIEAGAYDSCNPWGLHFAWTHLYSNTHSSVSSDFPRIAASQIAFTGTNNMGNNNNGPFLAATDASSHWKLRVNEYALDFDYLVKCDCQVSIRPYVGVFGATIDQKQNTFYANLTNGGTSAFTIDGTVHRKNDFWGVGPHFGVGVRWGFLNCFSLIGDVSGAWLFGKFKNRSTFDVPLFIAGEFPNFHSNTWRGRPMTSASIGLEWANQFCDSYAATLGVSYEFQYWWQQWRSASNLLDNVISASGRWGDLCLQGLVVTGGVTF